MQKNKFEWRRLVLLVFGLVAFAMGTWGLAKHFRNSAVQQSKVITEQDSVTVEKNDWRAPSFSAAMRRLGLARSPIAKATALGGIANEAPEDRALACEVLGYYLGEDVTSAIKGLIHDKDLSVRLSALTALGRVQDPEREKILEALGGEVGKWTTAQKIGYYESYFHASRRARVKANQVTALLNLAKVDDRDQKMNALLAAARLEPRDDEVLASFHQALSTETDAGRASVLMTHLAAVEPLWLQKKVLDMAPKASGDLRYQISRVLVGHCVPDRVVVFAKMLEVESNPAAWQSIYQMALTLPAAERQTLQILVKNQEYFVSHPESLGEFKAGRTPSAFECR